MRLEGLEVFFRKKVEKKRIKNETKKKEKGKEKENGQKRHLRHSLGTGSFST